VVVIPRTIAGRHLQVEDAHGTALEHLPMMGFVVNLDDRLYAFADYDLAGQHRCLRARARGDQRNP
jgi:hypothetical protein